MRLDRWPAPSPDKQLSQSNALSLVETCRRCNCSVRRLYLGLNLSHPVHLQCMYICKDPSHLLLCYNCRCLTVTEMIFEWFLWQFQGKYYSQNKRQNGRQIFWNDWCTVFTFRISGCLQPFTRSLLVNKHFKNICICNTSIKHITQIGKYCMYYM